METLLCVTISVGKLLEDFSGFHPIAVVWVQHRSVQTQSWIMAVDPKGDLKTEF